MSERQFSNPTSASVPTLAPVPATPPTARLLRLCDALADFNADAAAAHAARASGTPRGPLSGLASLDRELGGAFAPGLHFLHGQPGAGKTAFALQVAASCQCPALFVTCEMAPAELLRRHTARATGTFLGRFKSGEMHPADAARLALQAADAAPALAFMDATRDPAPPAWMLEAAHVVRGDAAHLLVVVDSLHSWVESVAPTANEYEALNAGVVALRKLAASLRCAVLVVSERNRAAMDGGGLSAGAGTRKIEYSAETVIDLKRAPDAKDDGAGEVAIKLELPKNRHGAAGKPLALSFNGALQRFKVAEEPKR